jgi:two-component system, chemotaxis family, sensor kinase CheA
VTDFFDTFLDDYFAECDEHLTTVRRTLLALESSVGQPRPEPAVTEELFRAFHSLKGIAGMVEHREIELLAHEMETYLRAVREGEARLTTTGMDTLMDGARLLEDAIAARRNRQQPLDVEPSVAELRQIAPGGEDAPPVAPAAVVEAGALWEWIFTPSPELIARGINVDVVRARLRALGTIVSATPIVGTAGTIAFRFIVQGEPGEIDRDQWRTDGLICSQVEEVSAASAAPAVRAERAATTLSIANHVRVDLVRLDDLMRMIGDLVILRARLGDSIARVESHVPPTDWRVIQENTSALERQLRELRDGVMRVRLVPVGEIFRRVPFVVRDLARETGKRVMVDISGQATEIDKFLVERMLDPVLHVVRNAVSHGLESVEERIAAGKPPEGTITLSAAAAGEMVTIQIADDGRGIDTERVIARARVAGLPIPAQVDEAAILELISSPGFSTREATDRVSGRGFGMAVVRTTVQELGGAMRLAWNPGQGTRFTFDLPLTLAITDALIARVGTETFAVPQATIREVIEVEAAAIHALETGEIIQYRGIPLPIVRLSKVLAVPVKPAARLHAFVVGGAGSATALVVDRIVGQREIVVRSMSDRLIRVDGIAGATDLGDGRAVLILDAAALARSARTTRGIDRERETA